MRSWRFLVAIAAACCHHDGAPADRVSAWRADLHALVTELPQRHIDAFHHAVEADWRRAAAELDRKIPELDDTHVRAGFARLVAAIGDAHTIVGPRHPAGLYRLNLIWFDDGIFVGGADPDQSWAIGRKLVGVGAHSIDEAIAALTPLVSHDNDAGLHADMPQYLIDAGFLAGVDLAPPDRAVFELAAPDGSVRELELRPATSGPPSLQRPSVLPLHLQGPNTNYWNKYVESERMMYVAYNACANDPRIETFAKFAASTLAFVDQHPVDRFVIDLRSNGGGGSRIIEPLIDGLHDRNLDGRVFVIIGMHTFSSAVMNAMDLKRQLHATLVGGPTANRPSHYGEVARFTLPSSKQWVQYATKLFSAPDFTGDAVQPDVPVKVTSADWFSGRDPAMDTILAPK